METQHRPVVNDYALKFLEFVKEHRISIACVVVLSLLLVAFLPRRSVKAPVVGRKWWWEPRWLTKTRFLHNAWPIMNEGYNKYKDSAFVVVRADADIVVLSNKYIDELRNLPEEKLSAIEAHTRNFGGPYTTIDMAIKSNLHTRALQQSLTPNIAKFHKPMEDELAWALKTYTKMVSGSHSLNGTESNQWQAIDIEELMLNLIAHISARIFVGLPLCRDEDWIRINKACTINVFEVALIMREVPKILSPLKPLIARLIPGWWRLQENVNTAKTLAMPMVFEHLAAKEKGIKESPMNLLTWMVDAALTPAEADPAKIAHRQILLGIGSIYTTKLALVNICYDYCAYPQYVEELREEVEQCLIESGSWDKATLDKMTKLESFMSESQRMNPPNLIAFNRIVKKPLTLHDGFYIPPGAQIGVAAANLQSDPDNFHSPETFDPWRYYRARQQPGEERKHRFAMTDLHHVHFGHGKFACPGRPLALSDIKMTAAALLLAFDMRYKEGHSRPRNITIHEMVFPEPGAVIEFRRRGVRAGVPSLWD